MSVPTDESPSDPLAPFSPGGPCRPAAPGTPDGGYSDLTMNQIFVKMAQMNKVFVSQYKYTHLAIHFLLYHHDHLTQHIHNFT